MSSVAAMNMGLRAAALGFRFALTVFIARYLDVGTLGAASYLFAAVAMTPALLGFGLHHRLNREIVGQSVEEAASRLRDRLAVHAGVVLALLPVLGTLAWVGVPGVFGDGLAGWVLAGAVVIAVCEVVAFEFHHGLISLQQSTVANALLFIRSASWVPLYVLAAWAFAELRNIPSLVAFWTGGCAAAFIFLAFALRRWPWRAVWRRPVDLPWLFTRFRGSLVVYCGDVAMIAAQYADRALIGGLLGLREVGIYFFFWSFSAGIHQLVYSGVVQVAVPGLVQAARQDDDAFRAVLARSFRSILGWAAALSAACLAFVAVLVQHLGQPAFAAHFHFMPLLLLGMVFAVGSDLMNTALYAKHLDGALAVTRFVSAGSALLFTTGGILAFGFDGAPIGAAASAIAMFAVRAVRVRKSLGGTAHRAGRAGAAHG